MDVLPYVLRIVADEGHPLIELHFRFRQPDGRRGGAQRALTMERLAEAIDQGFDRIGAECAQAEQQMQELTGLAPSCRSVVLPSGWTTRRGPDTLVAAALERLS